MCVCVCRLVGTSVLTSACTDNIQPFSDVRCAECWKWTFLCVSWPLPNCKVQIGKVRFITHKHSFGNGRDKYLVKSLIIQRSELRVFCFVFFLQHTHMYISSFMTIHSRNCIPHHIGVHSVLYGVLSTRHVVFSAHDMSHIVSTKYLICDWIGEWTNKQMNKQMNR